MLEILATENPIQFKTNKVATKTAKTPEKY